MSKPRLHIRLSRPNVEIDSPLIDCRLVDLSTSGLGIETSVGLRLGVPYPFRLRDGAQGLSTEAVVRWCRLVRNEVIDGESRPVYRAGAAIVDWQPLEPAVTATPFEHQVDVALDQWIESSRTTHRRHRQERTIVHNAARKP